jgi:hypothetical protein
MDGSYSFHEHPTWKGAKDSDHPHAYVGWWTYCYLKLEGKLARHVDRILMRMENDWYKRYREPLKCAHGLTPPCPLCEKEKTDE